ncbi:oligosaccharide flippase family protein [Pseudoalteromonas sp. B28]
MKDSKSVLSGIGSMAVLTISSKLIRLLILMFTARFLTAADFGVVAAFSMVFAFAHLFAGMGTTRTIVQRPIINNSHIASALYFSLSIGLVLTLIMFFSAGYIAEFMNVPELILPLKVSSFTFLILAFSNTCSGLYQREGNIVFIGKVQALGTVLGGVLITVPLVFFDVGHWSIIFGLLFSEVFSILIVILLGFKKLRFKAKKKEFDEIVKYSFAFFFNNTIGLLSQQVDIAVVSKYMGAIPLGNYSRAIQLVEFPNQIYWMVVDRVVFPAMSAMKSDKVKLANFFTTSIALLSLILILGSTILSIGAYEIVLIMMGSNWESVAELLQILAFAIFFRSISAFMDSFLAAYGLVKVLTYKQIISLLSFVVLLLFAIDSGVKGVAIAVVISSIIRFLLTVITVVVFTEIKFKSILSSFFPGMNTVIVILILYLFFNEFTPLIGFTGILISFLLFMALMFLKPMNLFLTQEGVGFVNKIKCKF